MVIEQARSEQQPSAEEKAVSFAIEDTDAKLRRWEEALEDAAHRIKELRHERAALLKTRSSLEQKSSSTAKILPIPTPLMKYLYPRDAGTARPKRSVTGRSF